MSQKIRDNKEGIIQFLSSNPLSSSKEIYDAFNVEISYATVKRILKSLLRDNLIEAIGMLV